MKHRKYISLLFGFFLLMASVPGFVHSQPVSLVSINRLGSASGNNQARNHKISANGRYIVFESEASDLVSQDNNGVSDVFRYDLVTGSMRLVSVTPSGTSGNGPSYGPSISADGRRVFFTSEANDLLCGPPNCPSDTNGKPDVFRRSFPPSNTICVPLCTSLISVNRNGTDSGASFGGGSHSPVVSPDGDKVAFLSDSFDLINGTPPGGVNIYLREPIIANPPVTLVTAAVAGPLACSRDSMNMAFSPNGRYLAFESFAGDLTTNDDPCNGTVSDKDVFRYDRIANTVRLASRSQSGAAGNGLSQLPVVANDGTVVFESAATDLVSGDNNSQRDIFEFNGDVDLVSLNMSGTTSANGFSSNASISPDGRLIAFNSLATDMVAIPDLNGTMDVFLRDREANTTSLVSVNRFGTSAAGRASSLPAISADGRTVAFQSEALDLVGGPTIGGGPNIFTRDLRAGRTKMMSLNRDGTGGCNFPSFEAAISANGTTTVFQSAATNLVTLPDANAEGTDVFAARLRRPTSDFDEDGRTDLALWRPSNGAWFLQRSATGNTGSTPWGTQGDIPQPADYDGDGITDLAVFRPSTGVWYVIKSSDDFFDFDAVPFGLAGDRPVAADYTGDGRAEIAVFRPSTGVWYTLNLANSAVTATQWGLSGDLPVPVDYFGDAKADLAVFRPSDGTWYIVNSSTGFFRIQAWGLSGDKPVAGDYDGDERADIAVFRPSTGVWYVLRSSNNSAFAAQWGISGDIPQPGDYDGDWRADFAVWRPGNSVWYVLQSSNGAVAISPFGLSGDQPVASVYKID